MNSIKEQPILFFYPGLYTLVGYMIYGKIEEVLGASSVSSPLSYPVYFLFTGLLYAALFGGWAYYVHLVSGRQIRISLHTVGFSVCILAISLLVYRACEEMVGVYAAGTLHLGKPLRVKNVLTWFVSYPAYADQFVLGWYHVFIFLIFLPLTGINLCLLYALSTKQWKIFGRMIVMVLGFNILGLMYQDWFYFVSNPNYGLGPPVDGRYGVYFDQWFSLPLIGWKIPTMYLVANVLGLTFIWVSRIRLLPAKYILRIVGVLTGIIIFGLISGWNGLLK